MYYTYILNSLSDPNRFYIGYTSDLKRRLSEHNSGKSIHTNKFLPWKIKNYIAFEQQEKAKNFEKFLKSGNGRIFAKKQGRIHSKKLENIPA
ncbi:GIY-YIG nuclease family protein [Candidatus Dependentiae bacterium]|nr:GIY-YIG nuclease family protein [Candidatus Dependentiae bacterium]